MKLGSFVVKAIQDKRGMQTMPPMVAKKALDPTVINIIVSVYLGLALTIYSIVLCRKLQTWLGCTIASNDKVKQKRQVSAVRNVVDVELLAEKVGSMTINNNSPPMKKRKTRSPSQVVAQPLPLTQTALTWMTEQPRWNDTTAVPFLQEPTSAPIVTNNDNDGGEPDLHDEGENAEKTSLDGSLPFGSPSENTRSKTRRRESLAETPANTVLNRPRSTNKKKEKKANKKSE
jgi:hypothetical protein